MINQNDFIAEGFSFSSREDAMLAAAERKKVQYLESRMDYTNPDNILKVYRKAIEDRVFKTPVGLLYLKKIQEYLLEQTQIEKDQVPAIPLYTSFEMNLRPVTSPAKQRIAPAVAPVREKKNSAKGLSIILNIILGIAVLLMLGMAMGSEQPNIINYRRAITNQYAAWEQDLTQREQIIREKERELGIESQK